MIRSNHNAKKLQRNRDLITGNLLMERDTFSLFIMTHFGAENNLRLAAKDFLKAHEEADPRYLSPD